MSNLSIHLNRQLSGLKIRLPRWAAVTAAVILGGLLPAATLRAEELPKVIVVATKNMVYTANDSPGVFTLSLSKAKKSKVTIHYTIKGTAANGTDYREIAATKVIKAGKTSVNINVVPIGNDGGQDRTVKISLKTGPGYTLGNRKNATVQIVYVIILP